MLWGPQYTSVVDQLVEIGYIPKRNLLFHPEQQFLLQHTILLHTSMSAMPQVSMESPKVHEHELFRILKKAIYMKSSVIARKKVNKTLPLQTNIMVDCQVERKVVSASP